MMHRDFHAAFAPRIGDRAHIRGVPFKSNARPRLAKSVYSFKIDRIKVPDDF
jgi:hypothetical protein